MQLAMHMVTIEDLMPQGHFLRKLETGGYLTTYSQEFQGRKRKYYSITEAGRDQLEYLRKEWREYRDTIDDIVEGRLRK